MGRRVERGMRSAECGIARGVRSRHDRRPDIPHSAFHIPHSLGTGIYPVPTYLSPMPLRLAEHPEHDRPRERLWAVGPAALTGHELLAILLGTGCAGRDALVVAGELLAVGEGSLRPLRRPPPAPFARIPRGGRGQAPRAAAAVGAR